jgi:hypothetical protein
MTYDNMFRLTQNVHHREAVVESKANEEATQAELPEVTDEGGRYTCLSGTMKGLIASLALSSRLIRLTSDKSNEIASSERRNSSVTIGDPAEQQSTDDGSAEEDRLRERREVCVVTHPVELLGGKPKRFVKRNGAGDCETQHSRLWPRWRMEYP